MSNYTSTSTPMTELYMPRNATYNTSGVPVDYQDRMAQRMMQSEAKHYYDGFMDGKHAAANSILETISNLRKDVNNGYMFDMVDEIEKMVLTLKGVEK